MEGSQHISYRSILNVREATLFISPEIFVCEPVRQEEIKSIIVLL